MTPVRSFPAAVEERHQAAAMVFITCFIRSPAPPCQSRTLHIVLRIRQAASCQWEGSKTLLPRKAQGLRAISSAAQVDDGGNPPLPELFQLPFL